MGECASCFETEKEIIIKSDNIVVYNIEQKEGGM